MPTTNFYMRLVIGDVTNKSVWVFVYTCTCRTKMSWGRLMVARMHTDYGYFLGCIHAESTINIALLAFITKQMQNFSRVDSLAMRR